ncbi:MAG: CsbD family protein [Rothia sp. (in: high G+C Gram-positive bacteria)]|nr:CsbD family protein [Rothia sp. (in: high G+C Gram-positive bacteria)]
MENDYSKAENKLDELAGKAKESLGNVTGDSELETEGKTDQAQAKAAHAVNTAKEKIEGTLRGIKNSLKKDS